MKKNFLRCMAAVTALFAASCSSLPGLEGGADYEAQGEEVEVTFSISTETAYMATRADAGSGAAQPTIGKGLKIDKLIYAVYDENYTLLKQYGDINDANGQKTIDDPFDKEMQKNRGVYNFSLRLMRGKVYRIAFWAQNHESNAYDTRDLTEVKVNYGAMQNNDEKHDVFCKVEVFSVSPVSTSRNVILTRPMAQINVGAQNWPSVGTSIAESETSLYSAISLENVATSINVVKDEIGPADAKATFEWAQIPEQQYKDGGNGEKLYIYSETTGSNGQPEVNEYDYLSMCYALVPAEKSASSDNNDSGDGEGTETASKDDKFTLKVSFSLSTDENGDSRIPLYEEGDNKETLTVDGAPAHRNWRTNILLGIGSKTRIPAEPDEPNVPDTPNTPDTPNKPDTPPGTDDPDPDPEPGPDTPPGTDDPDPDPEPGPDTPPGTDDPDPEPGPDTPPGTDDPEPDPEPGPTPPEEPKEDPEPGHVHITVVIDPRYDGSGNGSTTDDGKGYTGNPNKEKDC